MNKIEGPKLQPLYKSATRVEITTQTIPTYKNNYKLTVHGTKQDTTFSGTIQKRI